jgi:hypothetical protein
VTLTVKKYLKQKFSVNAQNKDNNMFDAQHTQQLTEQ